MVISYAKLNNKSWIEIVDLIKSLEVQGAVSVAKAGVLALYKSQKSGISLNKAICLIEKSRPTEPCLRNAILYFKYSLKNNSLDECLHLVLNYFSDSKLLISKFGSKLIRSKSNGISVYNTHCHSSTVVSIFISALKSSKKFEVHNTETRPLFQGRITFKNLKKSGISVKHYVDSAFSYSIIGSKGLFLGCDAITCDGYFFNKIGSEIFSSYCELKKVPVYVCTHLWKFDAKTCGDFKEPIEFRSADEVWKKGFNSNFEIYNPAFDKVSLKKIKYIICEFGLVKPVDVKRIVKKNYPWMF